MIDLNFIVPEELSEIKRERTVRLIRDACTMLLGTTALAASIMLAGRNMLQSSIADITEASTSVTVPHNDIRANVAMINDQLHVLNDIQKDYRPWTRMVAEIAASIPRGNKLTSLELNISSYTLTLKGTSRTRDDLLEMKGNLEKNEALVKKLTMPIANLLTRENINFEMKLELSSEYAHESQ